MPETHSYDYAVVRVTPNVEREEFVNAAVVLHCPELAFLACRLEINEARLRALWPAIDLDLVRSHLEAFPRICAGDPQAGPIARLSRRERFQWLAAPRSTIIQVSAVHSGICSSPETALDDIFRRLIVSPAA